MVFKSIDSNLSNEVLGSIFDLYFFKLDQKLRYFERKGSKILFVSRAGVRIRALYVEWLKLHRREMPGGCDILWASRLLAAKGIWSRHFEESCKVLAQEFAYATLRDVARAILNGAGADLSAQVDWDDGELDKPATEFSPFVWGTSQPAHYLRWHLSDQSSLFERYVEQIVGEARQVVLVDSGWQGTTQNLLSLFRPELDWWGLYFGRIGTASSDRRNWHNVVGLEFESDFCSEELPATAIVHHRHLIEAILEPNAKSIESLYQKGDGSVGAHGSEALLAEKPRAADSMFLGIKRYLQTGKAGSLSAVHSKAMKNWRLLANLILYPRREDVELLVPAPRSADFGRAISVPVVFPPTDRFDLDSSERRVADSLWPQGQAAVEFAPAVAAMQQRQMVGKLEKSKGGRRFTISRGQPSIPAVAIITRTMDRDAFLRRALNSVSAQTFSNYVHCIVCDGGDIAQVRKTINSGPADLRRTILVDNVINRGMEAASNIGIGQTKSKYIVIHDDDDTWEPQFLEEMVSFLESSEGAEFAGAISGTTYVSEYYSNDRILELSRRPYNDWVDQVSLMEMACGNFFAPISFLFKRSAYMDVGPFDESLPVLGDWDFNLRFLYQFDIGVHRRRLANYHHRDVGGAKLFANSVIGSIDKHVKYHSIVRNKHARLAGSEKYPIAAGMTVASAAHIAELRAAVRETGAQVLSLPNLIGRN